MVRAAAILVLGMSLIPLSDSFGKILVERHGVAPVFVAFARFALGAVLLFPFVPRGQIRPGIYRDWRIWGRAGLIVCSVVSIQTALRTEPVANVFGAFFVGPIFSYVLSVVFLGERVTQVRTLLLVAGFAGVLLIVRPGFGMTPGLLFALLAGLFYGTFLTASRWLADRAPPRGLMLSQLLLGALMLLPFGLATWPALGGAGWLLVLLTAVGSMSGNLLLVFAYGMAPATRLAPFIYFQLVAATAYGLAIFGDFPDALTLAGLVLLIASGLASLMLRR